MIHEDGCFSVISQQLTVINELWQGVWTGVDFVDTLDRWGELGISFCFFWLFWGLVVGYHGATDGMRLVP
jgi:hypothetical protein